MHTATHINNPLSSTQLCWGDSFSSLCTKATNFLHIKHGRGLADEWQYGAYHVWDSRPFIKNLKDYEYYLLVYSALQKNWKSDEQIRSQDIITILLGHGASEHTATFYGKRFAAFLKQTPFIPYPFPPNEYQRIELSSKTRKKIVTLSCLINRHYYFGPQTQEDKEIISLHLEPFKKSYTKKPQIKLLQLMEAGMIIVPDQNEDAHSLLKTYSTITKRNMYMYLEGRKKDTISYECTLQNSEKIHISNDILTALSMANMLIVFEQVEHISHDISSCLHALFSGDTITINNKPIHTPKPPLAFGTTRDLLLHDMCNSSTYKSHAGEHCMVVC